MNTLATGRLKEVGGDAANIHSERDGRSPLLFGGFPPPKSNGQEKAKGGRLSVINCRTQVKTVASINPTLTQIQPSLTQCVLYR